jgi:ATP-dependent exoDNAse (exonuclease V) beta subunit
MAAIERDDGGFAAFLSLEMDQEAKTSEEYANMEYDTAEAEDQEELEEERRVAYVAVTRAERRLFFCASEQYGSELSVSEQGQSWEQYKSKVEGEKDGNTSS